MFATCVPGNCSSGAVVFLCIADRRGEAVPSGRAVRTTHLFRDNFGGSLVFPGRFCKLVGQRAPSPSWRKLWETWSWYILMSYAREFSARGPCKNSSWLYPRNAKEQPVVSHGFLFPSFRNFPGRLGNGLLNRVIGTRASRHPT